MTLRLPLSVFLVGVLAACGGGGGSSSALEGIYTLDSWNGNSTSCDSATEPALGAGSDTHFFVRRDEFFGESFISAVMCEDLATCQQKANDGDTLYIGQFYFEEGNDTDGWTANISYLFPPDCDGTVARVTMTGTPGVSVSIRKEEVTVGPAGMDGDDCDERAAEEEAAGKACESLELVEGTFVEAI